MNAVVQGSKTALVPGQAAETHQDPPMGSGQSPGSASDKKFCQQPGKFLLAKKTAFFLALATTNRVSELSAVIRNGKGTIRADAVLRLPLRPGFLFKNHREGRTPPPIEVHPLSAGPRALCTVRSLRKYLRLTGDVVSGPLFLNSRTSTPVLSSTVSKWLSEVIEEAGPGS